MNFKQPIQVGHFVVTDYYIKNGYFYVFGLTVPPLTVGQLMIAGDFGNSIERLFQAKPIGYGYDGRDDDKNFSAYFLTEPHLPGADFYQILEHQQEIYEDALFT